MGTGSMPVGTGEPLDKERSRICRKARDYIRGHHYPQDAVSIAILDTNIVLDWFVFRDPACAPLAAAIESGGLRWLASRWMRDEFEHVVGRGLGGRWLSGGIAGQRKHRHPTWRRPPDSTAATRRTSPSSTWRWRQAPIGSSAATALC